MGLEGACAAAVCSRSTAGAPAGRHSCRSFTACDDSALVVSLILSMLPSPCLSNSGTMVWFSLLFRYKQMGSMGYDSEWLCGKSHCAVICHDSIHTGQQHVFPQIESKGCLRHKLLSSCFALCCQAPHKLCSPSSLLKKDPNRRVFHPSSFPLPPQLLPRRCNVVCRAEQPEAVKEALVAPLLAGLASHHAGCLPAWKALVERCFQQGLLKVRLPRQSKDDANIAMSIAMLLLAQSTYLLYSAADSKWVQTRGS